MLPGAMVSSTGMPLSVAATNGTTNIFGVCCGMKNSKSQAVTVPESSSVEKKVFEEEAALPPQQRTTTANACYFIARRRRVCDVPCKSLFRSGD